MEKINNFCYTMDTIPADVLFKRNYNSARFEEYIKQEIERKIENTPEYKEAMKQYRDLRIN